MGFTIDDGTGSGRSTGVDEDNRLKVNAVTQTTEHFANHIKGEAYNVLFSATPSGAGVCFFYMKNESENDLVIEGVNVFMQSDQYIDVYLNDTGIPANGNEIIPVNLNSGSGNNALGVFEDGATITGLVQGSKIFRLYHASSAESNYINFNQDVVLKKNGILTLYIETGLSLIEGHLAINFHDPNE